MKNKKCLSDKVINAYNIYVKNKETGYENEFVVFENEILSVEKSV